MREAMNLLAELADRLDHLLDLRALPFSPQDDLLVAQFVSKHRAEIASALRSALSAAAMAAGIEMAAGVLDAQLAAMVSAQGCLELSANELARLAFDISRVKQWAADIRSLSPLTAEHRERLVEKVKKRLLDGATTADSLARAVIAELLGKDG